jgi:hypothetical protein
MEYKFRVKMRDGTEKLVIRQEREPIPDDKRDVPIEIDGATVLVRIQQIWSNGDVHAFELQP